MEGQRLAAEHQPAPRAPMPTEENRFFFYRVQFHLSPRFSHALPGPDTVRAFLQLHHLKLPPQLPGVNARVIVTPPSRRRRKLRSLLARLPAGIPLPAPGRQSRPQGLGRGAVPPTFKGRVGGLSNPFRQLQLGQLSPKDRIVLEFPGIELRTPLIIFVQHHGQHHAQP